MQGLEYLILITQREYSEDYLEFFRRHGVHRIISNFCSGTSRDKTLDYLGIERTQKVMMQAMVRTESMRELVRGLYEEMNLGSANEGLAVFVPIDGIGGASSLTYFAGEKEINREECEIMNDTNDLVLLITIADKGNTELVMEAARSAGASGGTVVRAKGTGAEIAKFFGISISEEKDMVYIVAKREDRDPIMKSIMENAGRDTAAHGVVFSIPVDKVAGIKRFESI